MPVAARCSYAEIDRQVERARRARPGETERRRAEAAEKRHVRWSTWAMTYGDGLVPITAMAPSPSRSRSRTTRTTRSARLDPAIPLRVRRSMVLGMLGGRHGDAR